MAEKKRQRRLRLPRLSRRWRIVRNLAVALICLYALWARADYPLPTAELEFRRLERENLLGRSEIQGAFQGTYKRDVVYGVQGDQVLVGRGWGLEYWPREEAGPTLISVSEYFTYAREMLFAAADVPEGTASARLNMTIDCWYAPNPGGGTSISAREGGYPPDNGLDWKHWERDYQAEGELLKEGGVLFRVLREDGASVEQLLEETLFSMLARKNTYWQPDTVRGVNCRIEAVFYDESGAELDRAVLSTPEGGKTDAS